MDRQEFIQTFDEAPDELDMASIQCIVRGCLERCHDKYPQYELGHMNIISTAEELAECTTAISRRVRGRTQDNYEILEEMGDVFLSLMCIAQIFGISETEIKKAINAKAHREAMRIEKHKQGLETD